MAGHHLGQGQAQLRLAVRHPHSVGRVLAQPRVALLLPLAGRRRPPRDAAHAGPRELGCSEFFCDWLYDPKKNGRGGAFMDYCCYGAVLARAILGLPERVTACVHRLVKDDIEVEDNGLLIMSYPEAIAVSEGSWTQIGKLSAYTTLVYGTEGTLLMEPRVGGQLYLATNESPVGDAVQVPDVPGQNMNATAHLAHCIASGEPALPLCDPLVCRDAQAILDAGINAAERGESVAIEN